jgi:hypothetical protein
MDFIVIAQDATDPGALERRLAARPDHLAYIETHRHRVKMGVATLDDTGTMNGSVMLLRVDSREALDRWLASEPYVLAKVWGTVVVKACSIGPAFRPLFEGP